MDFSQQGSSVHGIFQARVLEWVPSPGDLPNPGIEPRSPTLQADALPSEPPGKPLTPLGRDNLTDPYNPPPILQPSSLHEAALSNHTASVLCNSTEFPAMDLPLDRSTHLEDRRGGICRNITNRSGNSAQASLFIQPFASLVHPHSMWCPALLTFWSSLGDPRPR